MAQLPSQLSVLRAMVNTANELGGLRDLLYRLVTDVGTGIDVNSSLGRQRPDGRWEIDRILIRGRKNAFDTSQVKLHAPLSTGEPVAPTPPDCAVQFPNLPSNDPLQGLPISEAVSVPLPVQGPTTAKVLITLVAHLPDPPQGEPGVLWAGTLVHEFTPDAGGDPDKETHPLFFWVPGP